MKLTKYSAKDNTLYINTEAIWKNAPNYMKKPYAERIAESPYRAEIEAEIAKHKGCKIGEFCEG